MNAHRLVRLEIMSQRRKDRASRQLADCLAAHEQAVARHQAAALAHDAACQGEQDAIVHMRVAPGEEQRRIWVGHQVTAREQARATLDYAAIDVDDALEELTRARRVLIRLTVKHDRISEMIRKMRAALSRLRDERGSEEHAEAAHLRQRPGLATMSGGIVA